MTVFSGRRVAVGIGKEATRGGGIAATYWLPHTSIGFSDKINRDVVEGSYGSIAAPLTAYVTGKYAEGNIEGEINVNSFGLILLAVFGTDSPTADTPEVGVHTHVYTLQDDNQCDSLAIQVDDPIGDLMFKLTMLNSLTIDISTGEVVTFSSNFMSKAHTDSSSTPSWAKDHHFTSAHLTFKVANNTGLLAAATAISIKNLSISFEKNVQRIDVLGTFEPEDIVNTTMRISGSLELNYENRTWRDYMLNGTIKAMQIELESDRISIGAATKPKLDMVFPKVQFHSWEPARGVDDVASQSLNFDIFLDISTGTNRLWSTMNLINTVTSY